MNPGSRGWAVAWAAVLMTVAFAVGFRTTRDLDWPNEHDLYRDMASARSFLQEGFGRDPCYLGETVWYNPLTPVAMALAHKVTGWPLPVAVARCGTYLNLLAPILFFLMAAALLDRWTALLALAGFLFSVGGKFPSWAAATYSPWLYPVNFAQGFFYLLVIRIAVLRRRPLSRRWALLTGILWGITFLAHTAPAMLFPGILLLFLLGPVWRGEQSIPEAARLLVVPGVLMAGVAALTALPFDLSIVGHYGLKIVNHIPKGYVPEFLGYRGIPLMIGRHLDLPVLVAWYGLYIVVQGRCDPFARRILLPWLALTAAAIFYGYVVVGFAKAGVRLPIIVPAYHFLFYFKAAMSILFGLGLADLARLIVSRIARHHPLPPDSWTRRVSLALALWLAIWNAPAYLARYDYEQGRREALLHGAERHRIAVYNWAMAYARAGDVFLASDDMGLFGVVPAGPKVVAVDPYMASPYVDSQTRDRDRNRMFEQLAAGDALEFLRLARLYRVTYVVDESAGRAVAPSLIGRELEEVLASGPVRLYRVSL